MEDDIEVEEAVEVACAGDIEDWESVGSDPDSTGPTDSDIVEFGCCLLSTSLSREFGAVLFHAGSALGTRNPSCSPLSLLSALGISGVVGFTSTESLIFLIAYNNNFIIFYSRESLFRKSAHQAHFVSAVEIGRMPVSSGTALECDWVVEKCKACLSVNDRSAAKAWILTARSLFPDNFDVQVGNG